MSTILVTGASGFIGLALVKKLQELAGEKIEEKFKDVLK